MERAAERAGVKNRIGLAECHSFGDACGDQCYRAMWQHNAPSGDPWYQW
jgi:hypothetical protein